MKLKELNTLSKILIGIIIIILIFSIVWLLIKTSKEKDDLNDTINNLFKDLNEDTIPPNFTSNYFNYKGIIAKQDIDNDWEKYSSTLKNLKNTKELEEKINTNIKEFVKKITNKEYQVELIEILNTQKINDEIETIRVIFKTKENGSNWLKKEGIFTFAKNKIIDIEIINAENEIISLFADFTTNYKIKTTGYYVYKTPETWHEIKFNSDYTASYLPWFCPGSGCGGYAEEGTYTLNNNHLTITFTHDYDDMGEKQVFTEPDIWELDMKSNDEIVMDKMTFTWQEEYED